MNTVLKIRYIRNNADITPYSEKLRNTDMKELSEIRLGGFEIRKNDGKNGRNKNLV